MVDRAWYDTTSACKALGIHRETLAKLRREQLQKGKHWKVKNPQAQRLTYLYRVGEIDKLQSEVLTEVAINPPIKAIADNQEPCLDDETPGSNP